MTLFLLYNQIETNIQGFTCGYVTSVTFNKKIVNDAKFYFSVRKPSRFKYYSDDTDTVAFGRSTSLLQLLIDVL